MTAHRTPGGKRGRSRNGSFFVEEEWTWPDCLGGCSGGSGHRSSAVPPWSPDVYKRQANVRVVKLMTFGAFAEVVPGVDGLIHISQIADHRIDKPGDVLSEGQMVDVKIIDIDYDNKKVSLSIRALLEGGDEPAESEDVNEE